MFKSDGLTRVAILGASGYTGIELVRLLATHPRVSVTALAGDSQAGKSMAEIYPHAAPLALPALVKADEIDWSRIDVAFGCLPHGASQSIIAAIPDSVKVVDLSADFRLANVETYAAWYGHEHLAPQLQQKAVYGLSEWARDAVKKARLVANPGCYPTAAQLPLIPLLRQHLIRMEGIVIDAKSGVSGAGRASKQQFLFTEVDGGMSAYGVGNHRHTPEIEQGLSEAAGRAVEVSFTPHLIPMKRGIFATIYAQLADNVSVKQVDEALRDAYREEAFVHVMPAGSPLSTHMVMGSNHCLMACHADRRNGHVILTSVIDNLCKGASGQAVQNMNIMCGFEESMGLPKLAVYP